ncbi:MAG: hypothetical protein Hyperionvirus1_117 [Hyperionvirus sp.]|uniref:Uncharacterized protein n=1 Tax=Hyperionvirus sp. TaxID=2487770 RepID=A0A3G5A5T8_9VIRU|nr:MAG: hypothetical protein Hyperionvirus1_117 [Hyperionvirus sp.]
MAGREKVCSCSREIKGGGGCGGSEAGGSFRRMRSLYLH